MNDALMPVVPARATTDILATNAHTQAFGLTLTPDDARALVATAQRALLDTGRIELGTGVFGALIHAFCDSPYIARENYAETLAELTEIFYYYKNATRDEIADDELIDVMKNAFNGACRGSTELLAGRALDAYARDGGVGDMDADEYGEDDNDE